jgi:hypothetical protein
VPSLHPDGYPSKTIRAKLGDRRIVWVTYPPFFRDVEGEYLLERGDVLFIVPGRGTGAGRVLFRATSPSSSRLP